MIDEVCKKCKLHEGCNSPFMNGSGSNSPDILFIGEAPGEFEDSKGEPFVGRSGELLRETIELFELQPEQYRFTNAVRCRPPDNRNPTKNELQHCSKFLVEEIEQTNPRIIMLLGNAPLKSVLGESGITHWNGVVIEREDFTYVPALHPAFILHNSAREDVLKDWITAFENAVKAVNGKSYKAADSHYEYIYPEYVNEIEEMAEELLDFDGIVTYDIETISRDELNPDNKMLSLAFAHSHKAWSFPLDHEESFWNNAERRNVVDICETILKDAKIVTHTKFDCKHTRRLLNINFQQYGDTIHLSRLLNAHHYEHGLKRLAGLHLQMYDYDRELKDYVAEHPEADYDRGGHYGNVPLDILLPYGGKDVAATWLLHDKLFQQLTDKQKALYVEMIVPADYVLGRIESNGFKLDYSLIKRYKNIYEIIKKKLYNKLLDDKDVKAFVSEKQNELDEDWQKRNKKSKRELKKHYFKFNPNSSQQISEVLYERKNYPVPGRTPKGAPSVKRDLLKEVMYDFRVEGKPVQFLEDYMYWKLISTILSKSYNPMLSENSDWYAIDGRVHSDYTIGGARTGRIASSKPNLQNIPTVEKEPGTVLQYLPVKNAFTHTWKGGCLCMVDYSGMELRVMASVAGIQGMIDVFGRGGDVHKYVSSLIYGIPEDKIDKFQRYRGKWCNWSLLYLGDWWTLYNLYRINGLTQDEAKRVTNIYFEAFPELNAYHVKTIEFLMEHGYVESPFGRRLEVPSAFSEIESVQKDGWRTAVNMPIQGAAADTLEAASVVIDHYMHKEEFKSLLVNTVHDSLVADIYPGELENFQDLAKNVMENMPEYAKEFMPNVDFSWLKVPLKADFEVGSHYGAYDETDSISKIVCEECGKFCKGSEIINAGGLLCGDCGHITLNKNVNFGNSYARYLYNESLHIARFSELVFNNYSGARKPVL